jgi:hypothetical protein
LFFKHERNATGAAKVSSRCHPKRSYETKAPPGKPGVFVFFKHERNATEAAKVSSRCNPYWGYENKAPPGKPGGAYLERWGILIAIGNNKSTSHLLLRASRTQLLSSARAAAFCGCIKVSCVQWRHPFEGDGIHESTEHAVVRSRNPCGCKPFTCWM